MTSRGKGPLSGGSVLCSRRAFYFSFSFRREGNTPPFESKNISGRSPFPKEGLRTTLKSDEVEHDLNWKSAYSLILLSARTRGGGGATPPQTPQTPQTRDDEMRSITTRFLVPRGMMGAVLVLAIMSAFGVVDFASRTGNFPERPTHGGGMMMMVEAATTGSGTTTEATVAEQLARVTRPQHQNLETLEIVPLVVFGRKLPTRVQ